MTDLLHRLGGAHALLVGLSAAAGLIWALSRWVDDARPPWARRLAGAAALLLGLGLLLRVGVAVNGPRPMLTWWQWGVGLFVLPLFIRLPRAGGAAAMLFFVCLAAGLATAADWLADVRAVTGGALALGAAALAVALAGRRRPPAPQPPAPVAPERLHERLDSEEAREAADKYTRE